MASPTASSSRFSSPLAVALLTLAGFLVRLRGIGQSLGGDELLSFWGTWQQPLQVVIERSPEYRDPNPPLFFLLARASEALGDPTITVRLPSLIAGTLLIPLVWLLGRRISSERAALAGAALAAFNLTAVFYSNEARPYELLAFLSALSVLMMLKALDSAGLGWWVAWALSAAAVMYTHYTGVFVLAAGFTWACWTHRSKVWKLLTGAGAAALIFAVWVPSIGLNGTAYSSGKFELSPVLAERLLRMFIANPFDDPPLLDVPGIGPLVLFTGAVLIALGCVAVQLVQRRQPSGIVREPALLVAVALASPAGMLLTSAVTGSGFLLTRYLSPSMAALILCLAVLLTTPRGRLGVGLACAAVLASAWGCVVAAQPRFERPDMRSAAHWIDANVPADTVIADNFLGWNGQRPLGPYLTNPQRTPRKQWNFPGYGVWFIDAVAAHTGVVTAFTDCPAFRPLNGIPLSLTDRFTLAKEATFSGGSCGIRVRWFRPTR